MMPASVPECQPSGLIEVLVPFSSVKRWARGSFANRWR